MPEEFGAFNSQYLTVEEVACFMKISTKTVYDWCAKGYLPCLKFGRLVRIDKDELISRIQEIKNESGNNRH